MKSSGCSIDATLIQVVISPNNPQLFIIIRKSSFL
jgi:hypothetical protein